VGETTPEASSAELVVDLIISLDGYASADGWPGWWGLEGPEYLAWLDQEGEKGYTFLLGANTYRLMSGMSVEAAADGSGFPEKEGASLAGLAAVPKVVFSSTLQAPLTWPNSELVTGDAVEAVREMKRSGNRTLNTLGSISLCRSLLTAGLVDRFRVVVFPVITGRTGQERIYDGYPDVALEMVDSRTFDGRIQLLEYVPTVLDGPPGSGPR
jgi:dihydrofolate reductase